MLRRLLSLLTIISLLVCVAATALWVRSYFVADWALRSRLTALAEYPHREPTLKHVDLHKRTWQVLSARGRFLVGRSDAYLRPDVPHHLYRVSDPPTIQGFWRRTPGGPFPPPETPLERIGFTARRTSAPSPLGTGTDSGFVLALPWWLPFAAFAVLPTLWAKRRVSARRARRLGLCPTCGYDLRATPGKCPECGVTSSLASSESKGVSTVSQ